ncbi:MAG: hypothetical protein HRT74_04280 [Flavobacteriales bacterium]|nr:hypothetical protein [Flavobacteriales bacterium]
MLALDDFQEEEWIIEGKKPKRFFIIVLAIITVLTWVALIAGVATFTTVIFDIPEEARTEILLPMVIFVAFVGAIAIFISRYLFWNLHGKEIISLKNNRLQYQADFKYFKGRSVIVNVAECQIEVGDPNDESDMSILHFSDAENEFRTALEASGDVIHEIQTAINMAKVK